MLIDNKKTLISTIPFILYIILSSIPFVSQKSEGYDSFVWLLMAGQLVSIPTFLITFILIKKFTFRS